MYKKLSELDSQQRQYLEVLVGFMNETWQDDLRQRLKIAQKFGLDLTDENVLQLITPGTIPIENLGAPSKASEKKVDSVNKEKRAHRIYGKNWIVIQNRLLNAITDLDLNERRLIMLLSPIVRKAVDIDTNQRIFGVRVKDFAIEYGIKGKYLYKEFEAIADSILEKAFFYWYDYNGSKAKKGVSWVSECDYIENEGLIKIKLDDTVIGMLTVFDKANPFTKYERKQIVNLGSYGVILFELIASCMHQQHRQKTYTIEYLREKFNCVNTYPSVYDFRRYVIDKAINEIEKNTSYRISYTQKKRGRSISEIVFSFKDIREESLKDRGKKGIESAPDTSDMFTGKTDKQLVRIVHSRKFIADYGSLVSSTNPANQSSSAWIKHMIQWIKKDPEIFKKRDIEEYLDDEQATRF